MTAALSYADPMPLISSTVTEFLAQRGIKRPLGQPDEQVFASRLSAPVAPLPTEEELEVARLQTKFSTFNFHDMGVMAKISSSFLRPLREEMLTRPAAALLWEGVNLWYGIAIEVGQIYNPQVSQGLNQKRLAAAEGRYARVLADAERDTEARLTSYLNDALVVEVVRLHEVMEATLSSERDQMTAAADAAQREASEARRQVDAVSAQLARERAAHAEELARLTEQLTRERTATVNRERTARNELHQAQNDLKTAQSVIANLNAECERLEAQSLTPVSTPLEVLPVTKQKTIKQMKCPSELGAMSLRAYLVAEGVENVRLEGRQVTWGKSIPLGMFEAWCGQYPTPAHQLAQLRAIALPILRRAA